jgi:hypothetical protein
MNILKTRVSRTTYSVLLLAYGVLFAVAVAFQVRIPGELLLAFICIPRLHDMGRTGWWFGGAILIEIAALGVTLAAHLPIGLGIFASLTVLSAPAVALMFIPGQAGTNRFGDVPSGAWERRLRPVGPWAAVGLVLMIVASLWRVGSFVRDGTAQAHRMASTFFANPNNHTTVSIRGWSRLELNKILSDFRNVYQIPPENLAIWTEPDGILTIHFPNDIPPQQLLFLVNYVQYPKGFDLTHRTIGVLAHVELTDAFGIPEARLDGKRASIYVPSADSEHDLVYAAVQSGATYAIPFTNFVWRETSGARLPAAVAGL